jgi:chloride channel 3/4/5
MIEVFLVTLVTALLCFVNPLTRMGGTELVYNLFAECRSGSNNTHHGLCVLNPPEQAMSVIGAIATALVIKGGLTIVTFGIKLPAGIFIPSLGGECMSNLPMMNICLIDPSHSWCMRWSHFRHPCPMDAVLPPT